MLQLNDPGSTLLKFSFELWQVDFGSSGSVVVQGFKCRVALLESDDLFWVDRSELLDQRAVVYLELADFGLVESEQVCQIAVNETAHSLAVSVSEWCGMDSKETQLL